MNERTSRGRLGVTAAVTVVAVAAFGGTGLAAGPGSGPSQDAPGYQNGQKITVCHKGKTLRVALVSWKAHQAHGDTQSACAEGAAVTQEAQQSDATATSAPSGQSTTSKGKSKGKRKK